MGTERKGHFRWSSWVPEWRWGTSSIHSLRVLDRGNSTRRQFDLERMKYYQYFDCPHMHTHTKKNTVFLCQSEEWEPEVVGLYKGKGNKNSET